MIAGKSIAEITRFAAPASDPAGKHAMRARGRQGRRPPAVSQSLLKEPRDREAWFQKAWIGRCVLSQSLQPVLARARTAPDAGHRTASTAEADRAALPAPYECQVPKFAGL